MSFITLFSITFAPKRGIVSRYLIQIQNKKKITDENILKTIYSLFEKDEHTTPFGSAQLTAIRSFDTSTLNKGINRLIKKGLIQKREDQFSLTELGELESKRIVRLHRLWEQYLLKRTRVDSDHVHSGAEAIEHIITPEIEKELERELGIEGMPENDY